MLAAVIGTVNLRGMDAAQRVGLQLLLPWALCLGCLLAVLVLMVLDLREIRGHLRAEKERLLGEMLRELDGRSS